MPAISATAPPAPPPPTEVHPPPDPLIGRTLGGHYRITALLGRGGMSRVYQAVQAPLGRAVALKVLKDDPADPTLQRRFLFEASTTSRLSHPNTITLFDYGADQGLLYFAMELLHGSILSQALKRDGRFSEERTLHIARQICRSLREAHASGLVHRDLKPSNFFLVEHADEADFVKVLDFGLVKVFGAEDLSAKLTSGGLVLGTPHYMAPEQARGRGCDQRSDIYSLGVVLFEMLAGRIPYDGATALDVLLRHATEPVPRLRTACPGLQVSAELEAVVAKCMDKSPDERFQNMDELLAALPGDIPLRSRPPPPPLDLDGPDLDLTPVSLRSQPTRLGASGDTLEIPGAPRVACEGDAGTLSRHTTSAPPAPQLDREEHAPRSRGRRGVVAGIVVAIALAAGTVAWLRLPARAGHAGPPAPMPELAAAAVPAALPPAPVAAPPESTKESPAVSALPVAAKPEATPLGIVPAQVTAGDQPAPAVASGPLLKEPDPPAPATPTPASEAATTAPAEPGKQPAKRSDRQSASAKRTRPAAKAAAPEVLEALKERLARAVTGIRQCAMVESRRGKHGSSTGTLLLGVTVDPSGKIADIVLSGTGFGDKLESCMRGAVQRVKFEPFDGLPATLRRSVSLEAN